MRVVHLVQQVRQQWVLLHKMAASPSLWLPRISPSHVVVAKEDIGKEQLVVWRSTGSSWHIEGLSSNIMIPSEKLKVFKKTNHRFYPLRTPTKKINIPRKKITPRKHLNGTRAHSHRFLDHLDEAKEVLNAIEFLSDDSLTEVYFLGFSWDIKEGTQKHTQSVKRQGGQPARNHKGPPKKHNFCYGTTVILICFTFSTRGPQ